MNKTSDKPYIIDHFDKDQLGLKPFCKKLENYLTIDHDFVEESLVVSLNAPFGSGKSAFLKMWERDLIERKKTDHDVPLAITLNAWESDFFGEPLLAIISSLVEAIRDQEPEENTPAFEKLKEAAKDLAWFSIGIGNGVANKFTGADSFAAEKYAKEKKEERKNEKPSDLLESYQKRRHALWDLKQCLKTYFGDNSPQAFIFVDELDRCRPDYAVNYLETIKHVFDIHGLVFVLAIDYDHLENSAKSLYGQQLNFEEYFRKFSMRSFDLPQPSQEAQQKLSKHLVQRYVNNEQDRFSRLIPQSISKLTHDLITCFEMTPRQCVELFRTLGHITGYPKKHDLYHQFGLGLGYMLMCALKTSEPKLYAELGNGSLNYDSLIVRFREKLVPESCDWWLMQVTSGFGDKERTYEVIHNSDSFCNLDKDAKMHEVNKAMREWGRSGHNFYPEIHRDIEHSTLGNP